MKQKKTTKEFIRKEIAEIKKTFSPSDIANKSEEAFSVLELTGPFQSAKKVFIYNDLPDEVSTGYFIEKWAHEKYFYLPVVVEGKLVFKPYYPHDPCQTSVYGIKEPVCPEIADTNEADIIIVPGIAFDRKMNRIGRGKGFYDRFLSTTKSLKIGICFEFQLYDSIPTQPHDVKMDMIVSENELVF